MKLLSVSAHKDALKCVLKILWRIDPLLRKDLETNDEYCGYYAIGK
jgi:hypothetical protein